MVCNTFQCARDDAPKQIRTTAGREKKRHLLSAASAHGARWSECVRRCRLTCCCESVTRLCACRARCQGVCVCAQKSSWRCKGASMPMRRKNQRCTERIGAASSTNWRMGCRRTHLAEQVRWLNRTSCPRSSIRRGRTTNRSSIHGGCDASVKRLARDAHLRCQKKGRDHVRRPNNMARHPTRHASATRALPRWENRTNKMPLVERPGLPPKGAHPVSRSVGEACMGSLENHSKLARSQAHTHSGSSTKASEIRAMGQRSVATQFETALCPSLPPLPPASAHPQCPQLMKTRQLPQVTHVLPCLCGASERACEARGKGA